jgi:hypothetical protein
MVCGWPPSGLAVVTLRSREEDAGAAQPSRGIDEKRGWMGWDVGTANDPIMQVHVGPLIISRGDWI